MHLSRLIYFSERNPEAETDVDKLLAKARENNAKRQVTGALWFNGDIFIQLLEGSRAMVSDAYNTICRDTRHRNVQLVTCQPITERCFGDWSMAYLGDLKRNRTQILKFSSGDQLNPAEQTTESIIAMLTSIEAQ